MHQGHNGLQGAWNDKGEPTNMQQGHNALQGTKHEQA